jgi:cysteine desulfurase
MASSLRARARACNGHKHEATRSARRLSKPQEVAGLANARPDEVIFTSGATEANNLAILGLADALTRGGRRHIITSALEHKAVLEPVARLEQQGFGVTRIGADDTGLVDPDELLAAVGHETGLVTHVNNETGTIQHVARIADELPSEVYLHVDAAQASARGSTRSLTLASTSSAARRTSCTAPRASARSWPVVATSGGRPLRR